MEECGWKNRLYVLPIVVGKDSYEEVTEKRICNIMIKIQSG